MTSVGDPVGGCLVLGHLRSGAQVDVAAVNAALTATFGRRCLIGPRSFAHRKKEIGSEVVIG
ncbi:MAG: hypothetical protein NTV40_06245 [Solirubrobacterales bacterium]|nr:hypothetical protein [Solirubrobacterales bacterium]